MSSITPVTNAPVISQMNPTQSSTAIEAVRKIADKVEPTTAVRPHADFNQSPSQINRSYEMIKDPPGTVLKFTDATTKEVILQVPSEQSIKTYKAVQEFIAQHDKPKPTTNITV